MCDDRRLSEDSRYVYLFGEDSNEGFSIYLTGKKISISANHYDEAKREIDIYYDNDEFRIIERKTVEREVKLGGIS